MDVTGKDFFVGTQRVSFEILPPEEDLPYQEPSWWKWRSGDKQADRNQETNGNEETNSNKKTEYKDSENRYRCGYN